MASGNRAVLFLTACQISFLILFGPGSCEGFAGEGAGVRTIDETLQMELADQLFQEGDYYRAITEYKRFLFFFPRSERAQEALWKIARSYFHGKKWDEAIGACDHFLKKYPDSTLASDALLLKGLCLKEKKDYPQARYFFQRAQELAPGTKTDAEATWQIGLTYLQEEDWKKAAAAFRKMDRNSPLFRRSELWAKGLDRMDEVPQKSPEMAGVFAALLPGSGHLYGERYRDASIAFLLNGAFIWGMIEAFEHQNYVVGGILTFFELGWYSGNIYSAVASAHKYNRKKRQEYLDYLEKESAPSVGISMWGKTPILSWRYVF